jgi:hypothetical protein
MLHLMEFNPDFTYIYENILGEIFCAAKNKRHPYNNGILNAEACLINKVHYTFHGPDMCSIYYENTVERGLIRELERRLPLFCP